MGHRLILVRAAGDLICLAAALITPTVVIRGKSYHRDTDTGQ
jgi:hypothetical protein